MYRKLKHFGLILGISAIALIAVPAVALPTLCWGHVPLVRAYDRGFDEVVRGDDSERVIELLGPPHEVSQREGVEFYVYRVYPLVGGNVVNRTTWTVSLDRSHRVLCKHCARDGC